MNAASCDASGLRDFHLPASAASCAPRYRRRGNRKERAMERLRYLRAAAALLALLATAGCAEWPAVLSSSAAGETLRWGVAETPFATAEAQAGAHCAAEGRRASLADVFRDEAVEIARFACD
jgi:hypothetical protein